MFRTAFLIAIPCCLLSVLELVVGFAWCPVAESCVEAFRIGAKSDIAGDVSSCMCAGGVLGTGHALRFECGEERFGLEWKIAPGLRGWLAAAMRVARSISGVL